MAERRYPKFPMAGVGGIVVGCKGVLLVRRDKEPGKGLWSIPGGLVEIGETHRDALKREVLEETGIEIALLDLAGAIDVVIPDDDGKIEYQGVMIQYFAKPLTDEVKKETPEAEVEWFKPDQLPARKLHPIMREILRQKRAEIQSLYDECSTPS